MVRVLYVIDSLRQRSGITSVVRNYLLNMQFDDVKIDLIADRNSEKHLVEIFNKYGCDVYYMPFLQVDNIYSYIKFWQKFFEEHKYDIVHSHFNQIDYIVFKLAAQYGTKEFISHSHNTRLSDVWWKSIRNFLMCYPARHIATRWGACSALAGIALYGKEFLDSNKKLLIHNAINTRKFKYDPHTRRQMRKKMGVSGKYVIGSIGRFKSQKNKQFLLTILSAVRKYDLDAILLNIGEGEEKIIFEQKMKEMKLENYVVLPGTVNNPEDYLQAMDIFVLPSIYEGLPVVGIEAQASGLPCIFSDTITNEVDLLDSNEFVSLNESPEHWGDVILKYRNFERVDKSDDIKAFGYDIQEEAIKLAQYYCDLIKDKV